MKLTVSWLILDGEYKWQIQSQTYHEKSHIFLLSEFGNFELLFKIILLLEFFCLLNLKSFFIVTKLTMNIYFYLKRH